MGQNSLEKNGYNVIDSFRDIPDEPSFTQVKEITNKVVGYFIDKEYDKIYLHYNHFVSMIQQVVTESQVLPIEDTNQFKDSNNKVTGAYEFEPGETAVLDVLLPQYAESMIYGSILDSKASEHSARKTAMKNRLIMQEILLIHLRLNIIVQDKLLLLKKLQKL